MTDMRLRDWPGKRVRLDFPGHPEHDRIGIVVRTRRANANYVQRALVSWSNGEVSYAPVERLTVLAAAK